MTREQFISTYGHESNLQVIVLNKPISRFAAKLRLLHVPCFRSAFVATGMRKFLDLINAHTEDPDHVFSMIDSSFAKSKWFVVQLSRLH